jgi:unsaturated chondroitin disaccharide hydrolase
VIQLADRADPALFLQTFDFAKRQLRALVEKYPDFYPMYSVNGRWKHEGEAWTHWCDGFLPGMFWLIYEREMRSPSEARWWREQAIRYSRPLEPRKRDRDVHDLGFIFMSTYYRWFRMTQDVALKNVLIEAGRTMALRFQEKGRYLRSFVSPDSLFIDIMMNVGIIFLAARDTGDGALYRVAREHSLTSRRVLVRGDGSTAHEAMFDLSTGECLKQTTHQGYRGDSCWSRGLAWSLYGFGTVYGYTREPVFLETAEACADYYLANVPGDGVPPWDFDAPEESRRMVDTSAAAIAASGLLQLAGLTADSTRAMVYESAAHRILNTLCSKYTAVCDPAWEGILKGGIYHLHKNLGVNESVMWGEHFFVEALSRAMPE